MIRNVDVIDTVLRDIDSILLNKILLETLRKINLCLELPAGLSVVCLTVVIFGVVGLGFGVVASKKIIQMIFSTFDVY